ncbi:flavin reductase [Bacillus sp. SD075]|uniref:flavin reductase n=1 Tax=Bacillus sp. SD075 TaxID=2781732 RepID=UPI001A96BCD7|nr:flavin reductase [Bacillus sp. SD075]MBO0997634.1 flavin reductase [Bacillus sp. SD075]
MNGSELVQKGITVNSFTSVSLDPPLASVSLHKEAKACTSLKDKSFTIHILSDEQGSIAWKFPSLNRGHLRLTGITRDFAKNKWKCCLDGMQTMEKI